MKTDKEIVEDFQDTINMALKFKDKDKIAQFSVGKENFILLTVEQMENVFHITPAKKKGKNTK